MLKLGCNGVQGRHFYYSLHLPGLRRMLLLHSYYSTKPKPKTPFSCSSSSPLAEHLVSTVGFSEQQSHSTLKKLTRYRDGQQYWEVSSSKFIAKADSAVNFLKQSGLELTHIRKVICFDPRVLFSKVDKTLKPRLEILQELGFSSSDLAHLVFTKPGLLASSKFKNAAVHALRVVLGSDSNENVAIVLKKLHWSSIVNIEKNLIPNVTLLEKSYGIPLEKIQKHMVQQPWFMMRRTESFRNVLHEVEHKWGVPRDSGTFVHAMRVAGCSNAKTLDSKCEIFTSFGWTQSEVRLMTKKTMNVLNMSESLLRKELDFFMNELGLKPADVASCPALLTYSLKGRIVPRHRVLQALKEKGLVRKDFLLYSAACLTESKFLERFIKLYLDVIPNILEVYNSGRAPSGLLSIQGRPKSQPTK